MSDTGRPRALLLEGIHANAVSRLESEGYQVELLSRALDEDELIARLGEVHLLGIRSKTTVTKPASFPPMVTVTWVVAALSTPSWLLSTSVVVAPLHAANANVVPAWPAAQSASADRVLRSQLPLAGSYGPAPTPAAYESPRAA